MAQPDMVNAGGNGTITAAGRQAGRNRWLILGVIALAQLMIVLDATVMNIALPTAQKDLHFTVVDRQWVVTAYALAFGSSRQLRPPRPDHAVADLSKERIRRRPVVGGLINEYERAA